MRRLLIQSSQRQLTSSLGANATASDNAIAVAVARGKHSAVLRAGSLPLRLLSALAVTSCLLVGLPAISWADPNPGLTLFSGVKHDEQLSYRLDFGGQPNGWDRYRLKIPNKKLKIAVAHFVINYPEYYKGSFDPKKVELNVKGKKMPLSDVKWDKENHVIEIYPQEAVPAGSSVELILSDVKNPSFGGVYYFNCSIQSPGDVPLSRYIGTWIISINNQG